MYENILYYIQYILYIQNIIYYNFFFYFFNIQAFNALNADFRHLFSIIVNKKSH